MSAYPENFLDLVQGSDEWAQIRCGKVTASRLADMCAMKQNGEERAERRNYRSELISEILTGQPYPRRITPEMQWGLDQEAFARAAYELERDVLVETCGFVLHSTIECFGASPDGLVGEDGLIQIKCPTTPTHLGWILAGTVPEEYKLQMLGELSCTGRAWCDFVSYDPRLPKHLQLFVIRFDRSAALIQKIERCVEHFQEEIADVLAALPGKPQGIADVLDWPNAEEMEF
jgi:hypothetical protein